MAALAPASRGAAQTPEADELTLKVGYSASVFYDVAVADARAATKVLADALMEESGLAGSAEVVIIEDPGRLAETAAEEDFDILAVLCSEYLTGLTNTHLVPALTAKRGDSAAKHYVLLSRSADERQALSDFRGATLLAAVDWEANVPMMWMEVLLRRQGLDNIAEHFSLVRQVKSTVQAALPVFFRKADACLVPQSVYQTACELNPQMSRDLRVLAKSPGYGYGVVCISENLEKGVRETVMQTLRRLHESPQGKQLLTLFYVDRLVTFEPVHLESTAELMRQHRAASAEH